MLTGAQNRRPANSPIVLRLPRICKPNTAGLVDASKMLPALAIPAPAIPARWAGSPVISPPSWADKEEVNNNPEKKNFAALEKKLMTKHPLLQEDRHVKLSESFA